MICGQEYVGHGRHGDGFRCTLPGTAFIGQGVQCYSIERSFKMASAVALD